jgi:hypothetical protein
MKTQCKNITHNLKRHWFLVLYILPELGSETTRGDHRLRNSVIKLTNSILIHTLVIVLYILPELGKRDNPRGPSVKTLGQYMVYHN